MTVSIKQLAGTTDEIIDKLAKSGITNSEQLLNAASSTSQRKKLAKQIDVNDRVILGLANRADLSRVHGVAGIFSDLLEQSGVDTVKELAMRLAENLHARMLDVNQRHGLARRSPTRAEVEDWVAQAKKLPRILK